MQPPRPSLSTPRSLLYDSGKAIEKLVSFVVEQKPLEGKATAYVCQNYACNLPVTSPAELEKLLSETVAKQTITPS